jgi:hypothetical protein
VFVVVYRGMMGVSVRVAAGVRGGERGKGLGLRERLSRGQGWVMLGNAW